MNAALLGKIFGREQRWHGPCVIVMDAEAAVQSLGVDSIVGGGAKNYAPRMVSGRVLADSVCLTQDGTALVILKQDKIRSTTGEETIKQSVTVADAVRVAAVEFSDSAVLTALGLAAPPPRPGGSHHGTAKPF